MGGSAPKQEQSVSERALAEVSLAKHKRYKDLYVDSGVEKGFIDETRRNMGNTLSGRNLADVAQAKSGVWRDSSGSAIRTSGGFLRASGDHVYEDDSMAVAYNAGQKIGRDLKDAAGVNALGIGQGKAADAQSGLAAAARAANTEALGRARAKSIRNEAQSNLIGTAVGIGVGKYRDAQFQKEINARNAAKSERFGASPFGYSASRTGSEWSGWR